MSMNGMMYYQENQVIFKDFMIKATLKYAQVLYLLINIDGFEGKLIYHFDFSQNTQALKLARESRVLPALLPTASYELFDLYNTGLSYTYKYKFILK